MVDRESIERLRELAENARDALANPEPWTDQELQAWSDFCKATTSESVLTLLDVLVAERGLADQLAERFKDVSTWVAVGSPADERIQAALALYHQTRDQQ